MKHLALFLSTLCLLAGCKRAVNERNPLIGKSVVVGRGIFGETELEGWIKSVPVNDDEPFAIAIKGRSYPDRIILVDRVHLMLVEPEKKERIKPWGKK